MITRRVLAASLDRHDRTALELQEGGLQIADRSTKAVADIEIIFSERKEATGRSQVNDRQLLRLTRRHKCKDSIVIKANSTRAS
jgi:hypothetical protein